MSIFFSLFSLVSFEIKIKGERLYLLLFFHCFCSDWKTVQKTKAGSSTISFMYCKVCEQVGTPCIFAHFPVKE